MSADIAVLGIELDSRQVVEGTNALDRLGDISKIVEQRVGALNGQMSDTSKIMKAQAEAASAASEASKRFTDNLQREIDLFGKNRSETERYNAAMAGLSSKTQDVAAAMGMKIDAMHREEKAAREAAAAEDQMTKAADRFMKSLQDQVNTIGMTTSQLQAYRAAQLGVSDAAAPLIKSLADTGAGAKGAGGHMDGFSLSSVGARRELLVLAHEMSQGNFQKFGGSMLVLGEQTGAASLLFSAMGLSVLAAVAALGTVAYAAIKGATEQKHMNDALLMTGNYAGLTSDSLNALAHAAVEAGGSIGEAKKVATELAGSGKFTGEQIGQITEATVAWEHATGKSSESIIKIFESLAVQTTGSSARASEAVSRAALKQDDQYHFLTESVYEHIRALEKEGDAKGASALATAELSKVTKERTDEIVHSLGYVARGWHGITEEIGKAIDRMGEWGAKETAGSKVRDLKREIASIDDGSYSESDGVNSQGIMGDRLAQIRAADVKALAKAQIELNAADDAAAKKAAYALVQSEGKHAAAWITADDQKLQKKGWTELQVALAAYSEEVEKVKAANPNSALVTPDAIKDHIAAINKAHTATAPKGADDRAALEQGALAREQANLDGEKSIYDSRVKMLDKFHGALGLSDTDFYSGRAAARAEFQAAEAISYAKELAIVQSYKPKNAEEVAANKNKYDELVKQHQKFVADMRTGAGDDQAGALDVETKKYNDIVKATVDAGAAESKRLDDAISKQKEHNAEIGKSKEQIELAKQAQIDLGTLQLQSDADYLRAGIDKWQLDDRSLALDKIRLNNLDAEIVKRRELSILYAAGADAEANASAAGSLDKFLDPTKAHAFGDALRGGFDGASSSIDKMVAKLEKYGAKEAEIDKQRGNAALLYLNGKKTESEYTDITDELNRRSSANRIGEYATMTDAAQSYFDKGSKGYEVIGAASKVLHAAEMAMNLASIGPKMAAGAAEFFAESGWGGFAGVAAMGAVIAGFGVAVGGGSSSVDTTAKDRQAATGTGTVLGDSSAKSDSIALAISLTAKNTSTLIDYTANMVTALNSIETNIGGFASAVIQATGISGKTAADTSAFTGKATTVAGVAGGAVGGAVIAGMITGGFATILTAGLGAVVGAVFGSQINKALTSIFGGSKSVTDTGLTGTKTTLGQAEATGIKASQYTDTTTTGGWFSSDKHNTDLKSVGAAANDQFTLVVKSLADGVTEAAKLLGIGGDAFTQHLNAFVVDIGKISTKGLTGDEIQTAIQAAFSKMGDDMANWAVGGLGQFQKVGEGSLETLVRVATDYAKLDASLASVGATFGKTGVASIAARESLIALLGGIDNFQSTVADYSKNFLTQAEQLAPVAKYVNDQLGTMGLSWIKTRADFKTEIDSLSGNLSDAGAQKMYASLMGLESAFAAVVPAIEDTSKSMQEVADERKDLQDQLDTLTMTSAQLLAKQRAALDASNRSLFDQVQAATAAKTAQDALKTSLTSAVSSMKSFKDATQQLHDGLLTGSNSPLTPEQQYEETKRQYEKTKSAAMGGDTAAQGQYAAMLNSFLAASKVVNASDSQYSADFAETLADSDAMAKWAGTQVDTAQASLDALNKQIAGITDVNTSVLGVTAAVNQLTTTMGGTPAVTMPTPVLSAVTVNNDNPALVAQVAEITAELRQLRADMASQTGDQIKGTADATKAAAETVVSGTGSLASTMARAASYAKVEYA